MPAAACENDVHHGLEIRPMERFNCLCENVQKRVTSLIALLDEGLDNTVDPAQEIFFGFDGTKCSPIARNFGELGAQEGRPHWRALDICVAPTADRFSHA